MLLKAFLIGIFTVLCGSVLLFVPHDLKHFADMGICWATGSMIFLIDPT